MSKDSNTFVDNLKGAFQYMSDQAVATYKRQLAKWECSTDMWMSVLGRVIENAEPGRVPELPTIYDEIKRQQRISKPDSNLGFTYFRNNGIDYAIRVYAENRVWKVKDCITKDVNGIETHHQPHVGEPVIDRIPVGAEGYRIIPDNPARPDSESMPTYEEIAEYSRIIQKNLMKIGEL